MPEETASTLWDLMSVNVPPATVRVRPVTSVKVSLRSGLTITPEPFTMLTLISKQAIRTSGHLSCAAIIV